MLWQSLYIILNQTEKNKITLYTDGASRGNPGRGGLGAVLIYGNLVKEISKGFQKTTNNRMELMAVIEGLKAIKWQNMEVHIYTDSKYVMDAVVKGWLKSWVAKGFKGKKNEDLWREYIRVSRDHQIHFYWVKGHSGNAYNEKCDYLATQAADLYPIHTDTGFVQNALS